MEKPEDVTKEQLIGDLIRMRHRIDELSKMEEINKKHLEELNRTKAMFEGLFEFAPDAIAVVNREGRLVQVNKRTEQLFGYTREELLALEPDFLLPEHLRERHKEHRRRYMEKPYVRPMGTGLNLYGRRKDGSVFPLDISLGVLRPKSEDEDIVVLAVVRDVSERVDAERRQREAKAELERSNRELEQFAYSVSHDLRAPLRSIEGFIRMLEEDYAGRLDDRGRDYMRRVRDGAERMQELIRAMLDLSRLSRTEVNRSALSLTSFVKAEVADIARRHPDRQIEFVIAEDVSAEGDPVMLRTLVQNFMSNAVKFTGRRIIARIEFGVQERAGKPPVYFIKDDGAGFDMENADKLFTPFQRLHTQEEFPGIGMGLATVNRIIQHHGGRVWVESAVNKGATFYFTLQ